MKNHFVLLPLTFFLLLIACCNEQPKQQTESPIPKKILSKEAQASLWKIENKRKMDSVFMVAYTLMKEPDLQKAKNEQYRLTVIINGVFEQSYRLEDDTGKYLLTVKLCRIKMHSPYENYKVDGKVDTTFVKKISSQDWQQFKELIDNSYFWGLEHTIGEQSEFGAWELEGHRNYVDFDTNEPKYHIVITNGKRKSTLNEACEMLFKLSGLKMNNQK